MAEHLASYDLLWSDEAHGCPDEPLPLEQPDDLLIEGLCAADEAAYEAPTHTTMEVPVDLVPVVRELIARQRTA